MGEECSTFACERMHGLVSSTRKGRRAVFNTTTAAQFCETAISDDLRARGLHREKKKALPSPSFREPLE